MVSLPAQYPAQHGDLGEYHSFELSQLKVKELKSVNYRLCTIMFATSAHAHSLLLY